MIRTQISMTPAQAEALRRLAAQRRTSQAALLREALDLLVAEEARERRIERARAAIGAGGSGSSSTAVDHDGVLADAFGS
jgi:hypothetical protein